MSSTGIENTGRRKRSHRMMEWKGEQLRPPSVSAFHSRFGLLFYSVSTKWPRPPMKRPYKSNLLYSLLRRGTHHSVLLDNHGFDLQSFSLFRTFVAPNCWQFVFKPSTLFKSQVFEMGETIKYKDMFIPSGKDFVCTSSIPHRQPNLHSINLSYKFRSAVLE